MATGLATNPVVRLVVRTGALDTTRTDNHRRVPAMPYTLKQAAESVGKSKAAILRAIQSGKISAKRGNHGQWLIDPAELHRVYAPTAVGGASGGARTAASETGVSESEIRLLHEMLADQRTTTRDWRT